MSSVAVIVPVYKPGLSSDEEYAVRHLRRYLGQYDCYQLSGRSLGYHLDGLKRHEVDDDCLKSVASYSKLCLSRGFYESFSVYDYVLIYQLDCLVFRDELRSWCARGYDYVGAPVFRSKCDSSSGFSGACNGGLSLRKVGSFLRVLNSRRYSDREASFLADLFRPPFVQDRPLPVLERVRMRVRVAREVRQGCANYTASYSLNEDLFWSGRARYFYPEFRVAPPEIALQFAFEAAPSWCFERNRRQLPFGAHAWQKWDRGFWEPYLVKN